MKIVSTYADLHYPATRFIINNCDIQSYKIDNFKLQKNISIAYFKALLSHKAFEPITKPNA